MVKDHRFARKAALWMVAALLALQPMAALAQEQDTAAAAQEETGDQIQYYAISTLALKVRGTPDKSASAYDSIPKGATVYILEFVNDDWAYIQTSRSTGYVQRQYLDRVTEYTPGAPSLDEEAAKPFTADTSTFREAYQAYAYCNAGLRSQPTEDSGWITTVSMHDKVIVSVVDGDWCYARYKNAYGYIRCKDLFKWDRLVPNAGEIPGLDIMPLMIYVNRCTNIYSLKDNSILKTINPGAAVAAFEKDNMGRYQLPYWRTTGYINEEDVAYVRPVADYNDAQPGDLISVMSTYYAVGVSTLQFQGRNWNIHLASAMINGYVVQPGETYNQYEVIGPYRKSTGYHYAPVMKKGTLGGYGGGTCQVNTTFYIANIQVPILVTHRKVHADVGIYYAKVGFDAAVGGGDINLTLENTLPYAIRYQFVDSDGVLTCCIYRAS